MDRNAKNPNLKYLKEIISRFEKSMKEIDKAETPSEISECERSSYPVLREIQMVAPRLVDDLTKASRERREELTREYK